MLRFSGNGKEQHAITATTATVAASRDIRAVSEAVDNEMIYFKKYLLKAIFYLTCLKDFRKLPGS